MCENICHSFFVSEQPQGKLRSKLNLRSESNRPKTILQRIKLSYTDQCSNRPSNILSKHWCRFAGIHDTENIWPFYYPLASKKWCRVNWSSGQLYGLSVTVFVLAPQAAGFKNLILATPLPEALTASYCNRPQGFVYAESAPFFRMVSMRKCIISQLGVQSTVGGPIQISYRSCVAMRR